MLIRVLLTEQNENESELIIDFLNENKRKKKFPYKRMPINKQEM